MPLEIRRRKDKYLDSLLLSQKVSQTVGQWDTFLGHFSPRCDNLRNLEVDNLGTREYKASRAERVSIGSSGGGKWVESLL
jgi:hypothetical protein